MSDLQAALHGDGYFRSLTEIGLEVQKARTVRDVVLVAAAGLEALGFELGVVRFSEGVQELVYASANRPYQKLFDASSKVSHRPPSELLERALSKGECFFVEGFGGRVAGYYEKMGAAPELVAAAHTLSGDAVLCPLSTQESVWGVMVLAHPQLTRGHLAGLALFGLQLGSAIEMVSSIERLKQRQGELELVHELALAGTTADPKALAARALAMVCRSTQSDAAALHRFEASSKEYVAMGEFYGRRSPALDLRYRRFAETQMALPTVPTSVRVVDLPNAEPVRNEGFLHLALVPMQIEGSAGLLTLARSQDRAYSPNELRSAEILGVQMASLLERARLYEEASRLYVNWKKSYDELAKTQAELVRHERLAALGELAAVMAHEVRNPLGVIFNSLNTLKRLLKPTGDAEMLLTMVGEEAERLNRIVGDLLDFARPYELVKKPIAIGPIVTSAIDSALKSVPSGAVKVKLEVADELPPFPVDGHLLRQALVNLVVNAVQAMPKGGELGVSARVESTDGAPWLIIEVRDQGVGLSPRAAEKMFQPFFTTKATGTGLGLALVKRIVDAHQGEISARSNDRGQGTTFRCRFPNSMETRGGLATPPGGSSAVN